MAFVGCTASSNRGRTFSNASAIGGGLKYFVDPESGNISEKLSIVKNDNREIYLAIDNLDDYDSKFLFVKFKFGVGRSFETNLPARITTVPGLTSGSIQKALAINLLNIPFANINLDYNLFDYNSYSSLSSANFELNNRDKDLYCRGLSYSDDPTYSGNGVCDGYTDKCLYSYSGVKDQGWYDNSTGSFISPSKPQMALINDELYEDGFSLNKIKCLSDSSLQYFYNDQNERKIASYQNTISGTDLRHLGAYNFTEQGNWDITGNALLGEFGVFRKRSSDGNYYGSMMYPRAAKLSVGSGLEYLGYSIIQNYQVSKFLTNSSGNSVWVSGCNWRVSTVDQSGEHVGSCNVSASIDVFYNDEQGEEVIIASSSWGEASSLVRLQLLQQGDVEDTNGLNNPDYKTCSSGSECSNSECCYNGRCWSQALVGECSPDDEGGANKPADEICVNDNECLSLCCKTRAGSRTCNGDAFCDKPTGGSCISGSFCDRVWKVEYKIIQTQTNSAGHCQKRLCAFLANEECENHTCKALDQSRPYTEPSCSNPSDIESCETEKQDAIEAQASSAISYYRNLANSNSSSQLDDPYEDWVAGDCSQMVQAHPLWICEDVD